MLFDKKKQVFSNIINHHDDKQIFQFINPNSNDKMSEMTGLDLQKLIVLINNYYLELRDKLGLDEYITFGLELEFENIVRKKIVKQFYQAFCDSSWSIKDDYTLKNGAEITSPILRDNEKSWQELEKICNIVEPLATIGRNSGGHIHIGSQILGNEKEFWLNFIKLWSVYENVVFRFAYGNFLTGRPSIFKYAKPMAEEFYQYYENSKREQLSLYEIIEVLSNTRYYAVNFKNIKIDSIDSFIKDNTVEFRCPNGSFDPVIWQNNVNLFVNMLLYSKSSFYNDDIISERYRINSFKYDDLKWYNEIYLQQALELVDLLFNNNLDKIYFLKQYLKSFETCKTGNNYLKKQVFTKKGNK